VEQTRLISGPLYLNREILSGVIVNDHLKKSTSEVCAGGFMTLHRMAEKDLTKAFAIALCP
jgi:hypothetical protein